jgi:hypothetical protein
MKPGLLELVAIGVRHLSEVSDLSRRADLLEAAAEACQADGADEEAEALKRAARDLRTAEESQLQLNERFTNFTSI